MTEVFRHSGAGLVCLRQSLLESAGIQTYIRNLNTQQSLVSGLITAFFPIPEFWPALCVVDDEDYAEAMALLNGASEAGPAGQPDWICSKCKETIPGGFGACWNCGTAAE